MPGPALFSQLALALLLLFLIGLALELGYRFGFRSSVREARKEEFLLGTVEGACLGLVALLVGFSFASAGNRFFDRYETMIREANAIGTAYLRADVLPEPDRKTYRDLLRAYTDSRIALFEGASSESFPELLRESEAFHPRLWQAAIEGVRKSPGSAIVVLPPLNEVIDLHGLRLGKINWHTPSWVLGVLIMSCLMALATIGYSCGLRRRRYRFFTFSLGFLFFMVLWLVVDLDYPRNGLIQIDQAPMLNLKRSLERPSN